jgi:hypothetical protein
LTLDFGVKLLLVIIVIRQGSVNLSHGQMGMLEVDFFWASAMCYLVENDLDDFRIGVVNPGSSLSIKMDMSRRSLRHREVLP